MSGKKVIPLPIIGSSISTACGSPEKFDSDTPRAILEGKWIFFCTPLCQEEFMQDPNNSCLTNHVHQETD